MIMPVSFLTLEEIEVRSSEEDGARLGWLEIKKGVVTKTVVAIEVAAKALDGRLGVLEIPVKLWLPDDIVRGQHSIEELLERSYPVLVCNPANVRALTLIEGNRFKPDLANRNVYGVASRPILDSMGRPMALGPAPKVFKDS
jgi:hypothetical protein